MAIAWPLAMRNPIRHYDWGSHSALPALQGRSPAGDPEAELWIGGHPDSPSEVSIAGEPCRLDHAITANPEAFLGSAARTLCGDQLPFLTKVLAVERALSIQVHPTADQAAQGFAAQQAQGKLTGTFTDGFPKPEMLYALAPTSLLAGLRTVPQAVALVEALRSAASGQSELDQVVRLVKESVADALVAIAEWSQDERIALADATFAAAQELSIRLASGQTAKDWHSMLDLGIELSDFMHLLTWIQQLAEQHPGDPLIIAPMLLHLIILEPGETIFLPAGVPHAYLAGLGVEVMAPSDNVVRAGLTTKPVDPGSVRRMLDPDAEPLLSVPVHSQGRYELTWTPPTQYFQLSRIVVRPGTELALSPVAGPQTLLCVRGEVKVTVNQEALVRSGASVIVGDTQTPVMVSGEGVIFRTTIGQ